MRTLIQNCQVYDPAQPDRIRGRQDIIVDGRYILQIQDTTAREGDFRRIDGSGKLAIPGLINAHTHSPENVLRGTTDRMPLELWLLNQFAARANFPPRLIYLTALAGAAEMLRSGTTAVLDHFWMAEALTEEGLTAVMQAYLTSGMRASVAPMIEDQDLVLEYLQRNKPDLFKPARSEAMQVPASVQLELIQDLIIRWQNQGDGRLRCLPGPGGVQWCSTALLEGCLELAKLHGTGVHIHLAETRLQAMAYRSARGHSAVHDLDRLGLLSSKCSVAHCIWTDQSELDLLADNQAGVVLNPVSNLKLGSGIANWPEMNQRNIRLALGTDGASSNDNQNMFTVLKLAGLLFSPAVFQSSDWISPLQVMEMATVGGARVLGYDNLGRLRPGDLADIVLLELGNSFNERGLDAVSYLVFCETGSAVSDVFVNGRQVVKDGAMVAFDEEQTHRELRALLQAYEHDYPRPVSLIQSEILKWSEAMRASLLEVETQK